MDRQTISNQFGEIKQFPDRAFLLTSYVNSEDKKKHFIKILKYIRENYENSFIVLTSHLPIDEEIFSLIDSFVYSENNPSINKDCITDTTMNRLVTVFAFPQDDDWDLRVYRPYMQYNYSHHLNKYDGLQYLKSQRIEYAHVFNYDLRLDKLNDFDEHYRLMKEENKDLIYYDCDLWLGERTMNTELFSVKVSSLTDTLFNVLSFQEYDMVTSGSHESTYFNFFNDKNIHNMGSTPTSGSMGISDSGDFISKDSIDDVSEINTILSNNITMYLFTLSNNVLSNYSVGKDFRKTIEPVDSVMIVHNNSSEQVFLSYKFFDDNFIEIGHQSMLLLGGTFNLYHISNNLRYARVFLNEISKSFFDIGNNENYASVVRAPRIKYD